MMGGGEQGFFLFKKKMSTFPRDTPGHSETGFLYLIRWYDLQIVTDIALCQIH